MRIRYKLAISIILASLGYYGVWYSWSLYLLNSFDKNLRAHLVSHEIELSYDKVEIKGFPFAILYCVDGLSISFVNKTKIVAKTSCIESDLLGSTLNISLSRNFSIRNDNIEVLNIIFNAYPEIDIELYNSLFQIVTHNKSFTPMDIKSLYYYDHGYHIYNPKRDEIIFISKRNTINMSISLLYPTEYSIRLITSLNGMGNQETQLDTTGEQELNSDIILKISRDSSDQINDFTLSIIKGLISTELYELVIIGDMNYKRHYGFNGQINVKLLNFNNFIEFLKPILSQEQLNKFINIIKSINELEHSPSTNHNDVFFRIKGEKQNIKWGRLSDYGLMDPHNYSK